MPPPSQQQRILLVEDSPEDIVTAQRNLLKSGLRNPIDVVETGQLALDYVYRRGTFSDLTQADTPGIILLDLNLPDMEGLEFLHIIKDDPKLRSIPVIVMTSSPDVRDFEESRQAGADTYLTKPVEFEKLFRSIQQLSGFCFELVFLPTSEDKADHVLA